MFIKELNNIKDINIIKNIKPEFFTGNIQTILNKLPSLSTDDNFILFKQLSKEKNEAIKKEILTKIELGNLKLICRPVSESLQWCSSLNWDDLFQEGYIGLKTAINKFDYKINIAFYSYAVIWIKSKIHRVIYEQDSLITHPMNVMYTLGVANKAKENGISLEEFAKENKHDIKRLHAALNTLSIDSLNRNISNTESHNDYTELMDTIPDDNDFTVDIARKELVQKILDYIKCNFPEKQYNIFIFRHGFYDGIPYTLRDTAKRFNISAERVRKIEGKIFKILRIAFKNERRTAYE